MYIITIIHLLFLFLLLFHLTKSTRDLYILLIFSERQLQVLLILSEISISFCGTYCISQSPVLLNNLLLSLISVLWSLNWKNHFHFICIRKFDLFLVE